MQSVEKIEPNLHFYKNNNNNKDNWDLIKKLHQLINGYK